jgi:hypothetical protein
VTEQPAEIVLAAGLRRPVPEHRQQGGDGPDPVEGHQVGGSRRVDERPDLVKVRHHEMPWQVHASRVIGRQSDILGGNALMETSSTGPTRAQPQFDLAFTEARFTEAREPPAAEKAASRSRT